MRTTRNDAFTLIELLIVIAIIALLIGILLPALNQTRKTSQSIQCLANLRQVGIAITTYTDDYRGVCPAANDPISYLDSMGKEQQSWIWMGRGMREMLEPYLQPIINENSPSVLLCPSDVLEKFDPAFERTSYAYSLSFYHSTSQLKQMTSPLSTVSDPKPPRAQPLSRVAFPSAKILSGDWDRFHDAVSLTLSPRPWNEQGWWDTQGIRNHLFADGHATPIETKNIHETYDGLRNPNLTINGIFGRDIQ